LFDGWGKSLLKFGQDSTKSMNWFDAAVRRASISNNKFSASLKEFKRYGMTDLPKMFGAQSPSNPAFMQAAGFFKKQSMLGPDLSGALQRKEAKRLTNLPMQGPDLSGALQRKEAERLTNLPMQGPDLSGALQRKEAQRLANAPMQGPDLSGALQRKEAQRLANLPMQGPDLSGRLRRREAVDEQAQADKQAMAAARTNIAMQRRQQRELAVQQAQAHRQAMDASRLNIAMQRRQQAELAAQQEQANRQALAASRTNIAMRARQQAQTTSFQGRMSSLAMPMFNPSSPWANFVAGRQVHGAMTSAYGQNFLAGRQGGMMGQIGGTIGRLSGGSALGATAIVVGAAAAIGVALMALKKVIQLVIEGLKDAFIKAKELYSKSLTSGLGVGLTTKRASLAAIIGVSEEEVLKFGAAVAFLNPKIQYANSIIAANATTLAATSMNWMAMKENIAAVFSILASRISSVINKISDLTSAMTQLYIASGFADFFGASLNVLIDIMVMLTARIMLPIAGIYTLIIALEDLSEYLYQKAMHPFTKQEYTFDKTKDAFDNFLKVLKAGFLPSMMFYKEKTPENQAFMKKLPTSSWEKMGLVIGGAKNTTNELIREGNKHLSVIAAAVTAGAGVPRTSFGMNPTVANP